MPYCSLAAPAKASPLSHTLSTLAAAYAEAGRFTEAVEAAQKAISLAGASGDARLAAVDGQLLRLFRARKPYHQPGAFGARPREG